MPVLVTGGAGFIGSHLIERLLERGESVIALDNLATGSRANLAGVEGRDGFSFVHGSVTDPLLVGELMAEVDTVVHLAAAVGVRLIIEHPLRSLITNIMGAEVVLDAAWKRGAKTLVTSTSEIYGKNSSGPLSELSDRILGPPSVSRWAYSTSKAVDEILARAYHLERGLPTVTVRLFNTVGPRQTGRYGMVIPRFVQQARGGSDLTIYGDGSQTRCFCDVGDVVDASLRLLEEPRAEGEIFNVGNPEEISIADLAQLIIKKTESDSNVRFVPYDEAYEEGFEDMQRRIPDIGKLTGLTGWTPRLDLDQILDRVIEDAATATG